MGDEDVLEQARAAGLTIATGVSRLGDTFIRAAQQRAEAEVRDKQIQVEDAQRRYEAQAQVADELYRRAANPEWMRSVDHAEALSVWEAAQLWADLDQERFHAAADQVTVAYQQAYGVGPTTAALQEPSTGLGDKSRTERTLQTGQLEPGWPPEARRARALADHLNGRPAVAVSARPATAAPTGRSSRRQQPEYER